jgi:hypothetical protein
MCFYKPLRAKYFHEVLTGNVHEYSLKLSIGKARSALFTFSHKMNYGDCSR